jgi:cytochrome c5
VSNQDRRFFETFGIVLGAIIVFTIVIYFIANHVAGLTQIVWADEERASSPGLQERLAPVGMVTMPGDSAGAEAAAEPAMAAAAEPAPADASAAAAPAAAVSGEQIYNQTCFACHAVGAAGAPKIGDKADWGPRIAQGVDTLVQHAVNGFQGQKGIMPPKGGRTDYSDDAVAAAVQYMVSQAQ